MCFSLGSLLIVHEDVHTIDLSFLFCSVLIVVNFGSVELKSYARAQTEQYVSRELSKFPL